MATKQYDYLTLQLTKYAFGKWTWRIEGEDVRTGATHTLEDGAKEYATAAVAAADGEAAMTRHSATQTRLSAA